jgi:hypothetical protein
MVLVAAGAALLWQQPRKSVGGSRWIYRGQYGADGAIRAENTENYGQDCSAGD